MKARYAAFQGRPHRGREGRWHLVERDGPMNALDEQRSLCGRVWGTNATVAATSHVTCERCLAAKAKRE